MESFLAQIDFEKVYSLPNNDYFQRFRSQPRLTGKDLIKRNIEHEARRLGLNHQQDIIRSTTDKIWDSHLEPFQRKKFNNFADNINKIRNYDTIDLIVRINIPQITNNPLENDFFNGTKFHEDKSFESLILPNGF